MTKNPQEKPHNARCTNCDTPFYRRPGGRAHCGNDACKKALQRASDKNPKVVKQTKAEKDLANWRGSRLCDWMLDQCERAGTVETFRGITAAGLAELAKVYEYRRTRYGFDPSRKIQQYPICHVQPLCGYRYIGLSYGSNIFVGLRESNSWMGNKPVPSWAGASITKSSLRRSLKIPKGSLTSNIRVKLEKLLGEELNIFLANLDSPLKQLSVVELAKRVFRQQSNPKKIPLSRFYALEELKKEDYDTLSEMDAIQNGKLEEYRRGKKFGVQRFGNCITDSELGVLSDSLRRFVDILPDGQHRDNCRAMLSLVHTFGIYLGQTPYHSEVVHGRWTVPNSEWQPLEFVVTRLGELEDKDLDRRLASAEADRILRFHVKALAYDTLQGLNTGFRIRNARQRLIDHLDLVNLVPMPVVDEYSDTVGQFTFTLDVCKSHWVALEASQLVAANDIVTAPVQLAVNMQSAVERARRDWLKANHPPRHYRGKFHEHWGWKGEYPDSLRLITVDGLLAQREAA